MITAIEVASAAFPIVKFREGYEQVEVVAFVGQVVKALSAYEDNYKADPDLTADDVKRQRFQPTKFRVGYEQEAVNRTMLLASAALEVYEIRKAGT
jgi:DivIVA domain-containing protein